MKILNKKTLSITAGVLLLTACLLDVSIVSAQTSNTGTTAHKLTAMASSTKEGRGMASTSPQAIAKLIAQADKEISQRIDSLNKLLARIQQMKNVTDANKATLNTGLQSQITTLTNLKTKIDGDTDTATLKTDLKSITSNLRIYMLVIPQGQIIAAADRINTIATDLATVGTKLQARITALQTSGKDVTSLQAALTDLQSKLADAQTQSQNAINTVASLVPDQGNQTTAASNTAALKLARTDIQTGTKDVQNARKDVSTILKGVRVKGNTVSTTPSTQ